MLGDPMVPFTADCTSSSATGRGIVRRDSWSARQDENRDKPNNRKSEPGASHRYLKASYAATLLGVVVTLTGCAVGPHYAKPALSVNDSWSGAGTPQITAQPATDPAWWKTFNDPVLEQLIQLAYKQNLTLRVTGLRIMEARAVLGIATGNQYPQVQQAFAGVSGVGVSNNTANKPPDFSRYFASDQLGLNVSWEADFWRQYAKAVRAQKDVYLGSTADYQEALITLEAEVAQTYVAIRTFEELIEQARRNVSVQAESLRIADARFRNGATSELDVSQARALLESTRATIPQLEISLAQSKNALTTLLGQPTGSLQNLLQGPQAIPTAPAQVAVSIPAEVLRRRPDIRNAELVAMAQCERIGIAKADLYPHFVLSGTLGLHATQGGATSFNLLDPGSFFFAVGPQIYWDLFNYGRIKNRVRVEDARFQEVVTTYQNSVLSASQEVEDGIVGFVKALEAISVQQQAVTAARRSTELALIQYREGATDYQRVLWADQTQLQQENNLVSLRSSVATNAISLYKALGGGWEMSVGQPFVPDATRIEMQKRTNWGNLFSTQPATGSSTTSAPPPTAPPPTAPPPTR
jgi:NodT family efflux transporter outer membrane factor (OMF) lipoprotein